MAQEREVYQMLNYLHAELQRIETIAGTLASIEREHFKKLTNFDHDELMNIAIEEQNAARQLQTVKQMCLSMAQKVDSVKNQKGFRESGESVEVH